MCGPWRGRAIWLPASLLPDRGVASRAEGPNEIVAGVDVPLERPDVRPVIEDTGAVRSVSVMRWGKVNQDDFGYILVEARVGADRRFGDFVLPSQVNVGWWVGTRRFAAFFEARDTRRGPSRLGDRLVEGSTVGCRPS